MYLDKSTSQWLFDHHKVLFFPRVETRYDVLGKSVAFEDYSQHRPGEFMPLGAYSYAQSFFESTSFIGRYCSIGKNVEVMGKAHPTDWASSSPTFYRKRRAKAWGSSRADFPHFDDMSGTITIGHDVWIGDGVLLAHGVKLGTGAVVAARSIVTRDIPPYAIVAGSPARVVRHRFEPEIVKDLLDSKWWQWPLKTWDDVDPRDISSFLNAVEWATAHAAILPEKRHVTKDLLRKYANRIDPKTA